MSKKIEKPNFKNFREVSRELTIVENGLEGADDLLKNLQISPATHIIGITGPPGAGKSTLIAKLIDELLKDVSRIAVLAVDPSSPFSFGSLLGDRVRMQNLSTNSNVFIRSIATRGSLGGLSGKIIEMTDVLRASGFDYIILETVGVGQSEVEIAGLADITFVVLVPESGDEVQSIKAGIMEIGNAFIVNKSDREGAEQFANNLQKLTRNSQIPVFKTIATSGDGISQITAFIKEYNHTSADNSYLLAQKAWKLIQEKRMADLDKKMLQQEITEASKKAGFNLYKFVNTKVKNS
ncbi:methylmalonyl Co-A mutase-associated GTPase MeaB [Pedobacter sp. P351]|uniref:methylmalonyl Co-A mutase-associated GTPase MeaB n=1 Tax=Pedobacter superstes TaxID=3133441 RepID=UPI0030A98BE8